MQEGITRALRLLGNAPASSAASRAGISDKGTSWDSETPLEPPLQARSLMFKDL
jgi:hypothetical protein